VLVQAQVRHQQLELAVHVLELLHPPQFARAQPNVHLLPSVERLLGNARSAVTSDTGVRVSACFNVKAICSSVYLDFFMFQLLRFAASHHTKPSARHGPMTQAGSSQTRATNRWDQTLA
jgi:hypothetical protein